MKKCGKCHTEKPEVEFHKDKSRKDGRHPYCARCQSDKAAKWCRENRQRSNEAVKRYRARHPTRLKKQRQEYVAKYPEKVKARSLANTALKAGKIKKPERCSMCGESLKLEMHHHDYAKPLDVVWLCPKCHAKEGVFNGSA